MSTHAHRSFNYITKVSLTCVILNRLPHIKCRLQLAVALNLAGLIHISAEQRSGLIQSTLHHSPLIHFSTLARPLRTSWP